MATAQDRLKWAFNILAKGGLDSVDLYAELGKTEALVGGMGLMAPPPAPPIAPSLAPPTPEPPVMENPENINNLIQ